MKMKMEKAQRLGKTKVGINRPIPIVVKLTQFSEREMVRKASNRLKSTNYGISPQFPLMMSEKRTEKKAAFMLGDKLYVDGVLLKEYELAEDGRNINSVKENLKSNKHSLKVCSWNIFKGLLRKLADNEFLHGLNVRKNLSLMVMVKKYVHRQKCNGGGVIVIYEKWLNPHIEIINCCADSMIWIKISNDIMSDSKYLYLCSMYMPPDNNRCYQKYEYDVFEVLQEQIEHYCVLGNTVVIGDLNGRIGKENDYMYIVDDIINKQLRDSLTGLIDYECDL